MKLIESEIVKCLTPLDLRAIYDLLCLLNMHFLGIDPTTEPDEDEDNFISYFPEIDFSKMSDSLSSIETLNAIMNLKPEIKRFIFAKIISATQHILFWKTEREVVLYLFNLNFIEAKEVMMLNCSYVLRDLLPYSGCEYELTSDDFF